jgi:hypothetical protein
MPALPDYSSTGDLFIGALSYGALPPLTYLRQMMLLHDREENRHLYMGHERIADRL